MLRSVPRNMLGCFAGFCLLVGSFGAQAAIPVQNSSVSLVFNSRFERMVLNDAITVTHYGGLVEKSPVFREGYSAVKAGTLVLLKNGITPRSPLFRGDVQNLTARVASDIERGLNKSALIRDAVSEAKGLTHP